MHSTNVRAARQFRGAVLTSFWLLIGLGIQGGPASVWDLAQPHRNDRILVIPRDDVPETTLDRWCDAHAALTLRRHPALEGLRLVQTPPGARVGDVLRTLEADNIVMWAEPDYLLRPTLSPNDPGFVDGLTWNLQTAEVNGANLDIDATAAWEVVTDARSVIVAIVDSGLRATHEDLAANLWTNPGEIPGNGIDDDDNGIVDDVHGYNAITGDGNVVDEVGHGTHVAGIIGAVGNNGRGSVGVAWSVRLMPLKFIPANGDGATSDAIACIDYARAQGARIINASWGNTARSVALRRAIDRARASGMVLVTASGNEAADVDQTPFYPASFTADNIVAVTATDRTGGLADFSSYGATTIDLAAPGGPIYSTWYTSDNAYTYLSGTSMAAPHVSGTLALLAAVCPECTSSQLIDAVLQAVDPVASLAGRVVSGGRLNAARALSAFAASAPSAPTVAVTRSEDPARLRLQVVGSRWTSYWIEVSLDLGTWEQVAQVTTDDSGLATAEVPRTSATAQFCRAVGGVSAR